MNTLTELAKQSHAQARKSGWWDGEPRDKEVLHQLMITEICEASEEVRKNHSPIWATITNTDMVVKEKAVQTSKLDVISECKLKPEGEAIELVDCAIRLADYFEYRQWDLEKSVAIIMAEHEDGEVAAKFKTLKPLSKHLVIVRELSKAGDSECYGKGPSDETFERFCLASAMWLILLHFDQQDWNFWEATNLKADYNKTRSYRHGNKTA